MRRKAPSLSVILLSLALVGYACSGDNPENSQEPSVRVAPPNDQLPPTVTSEPSSEDVQESSKTTTTSSAPAQPTSTSVLKSNRTSDAEPEEEPHPQNTRFVDVSSDLHYAEALERLDALGVFEGTTLENSDCPDGFCPTEPVDRKTVAVWTVRVLDGTDPVPPDETRFADVDCCVNEFYHRFIERLAELRITRGCGDGTNFCPDRDTSRAEMAAFLSRTFGLPDGPDPDFGDIPDDAWYSQDVARLKASGITVGCGDGTNFCPGRVTTRAEMATFLYRGMQYRGLETEDRFDPRRSPSATGIDLDKLNHVVDNIDTNKPCTLNTRPNTSEQLVGILWFVNGCLFMEYQLLGDRTLEQVREQYADEPSVMTISLYKRIEYVIDTH